MKVSKVMYRFEENINHYGLLYKIQCLKGEVIKGQDKIKGKNGKGLNADNIVNSKHFLHDLIRGIYKPKDMDCMLSYQATEKDENYGKEIIWKDDIKKEFKKIILRPPNGEKDNRKKSDIKAAEFAMNNKVPIGLFLNLDKGLNKCLGLGIIKERDSNGNFIVYPTEVKFEMIEKRKKKYYIFRTNNPKIVNDFLNNSVDIFEFHGIANFYEEMKKDDIVLFVLGGDKPSWDIGLRGVCSVEKEPFDKGYDKNKPKYFKILLKKELIFNKSLAREEFVNYIELFDMTFIGPMTKGEPNQANVKADSMQVRYLVERLIKVFPNNKDELIRIFGQGFISDIYKSKGEYINKSSIVMDYKLDAAIEGIRSYIKFKGYKYDEALIKNLYLSLKSKPFTILSGISGTGKSKIAELFAEAIGANNDNRRFKLLPVKPDWCDATDLLGYRNLQGQFTPGSITSIAYDAMMNPELPYFICLDEMNLARVEYYFSDVLSIMETRRVNDDGVIVTDPLLNKEQFGGDNVAFDKYGDVHIPENLYIIGTVNMDETTFPFSKKVLDRANTIEFNKVNLFYSFEDIDVEDIDAKNYHNDFLKSEFLKLSDCKEHKDIAIKVINDLIEVNNVLERYNQHFGYRVRDEIVFYMIYATRYNLLSYEVAFDMAITQKILPKISGSNQDVQALLLDLFDELNDTNYKCLSYLDENNLKEMETKSLGEYKLSNEKIIYMIRRFIRDGFTTFWQ